MSLEDPFEALRQTFDQAQNTLKEMRKRPQFSSEKETTPKIEIPILDEMVASLQSVSQCCPLSESKYTEEEQQLFNKLVRDIQKATIESYPEEIREEIIKELSKTSVIPS